MHLILAVLGGIVTLLFILHRLKDLGIDVGWLNPFHWYHRQQWKNKVYADPLFSLTSPLEVAAGILYTAAKLSGDLSSQQKALLLDIFENKFKLSPQEATHLLSSNAFLIKDEDKVKDNLKKFIAPAIENFSEAQKESTLELADQVISLEERVTQKQEAFLAELKALFAPPKQTNNNWQ